MRAISHQKLLFLAMGLLAFSLYPTGVGEFLAALGMDGRAARIAGSQLTVMAALCGAGFLLIGIATWARSSRLLRISSMHADLLDHMAQDDAASAQIVDGEAVLFSEFDGLRTSVTIAPERGGLAVVQARCAARNPLQIWPRGLGPELGDSEIINQGKSWELWGRLGASTLSGAEELLEDAFGAGGVLSVTHDRTGIMLHLPNAPAEELGHRLGSAIRLVSSLARLNR